MKQQKHCLTNKGSKLWVVIDNEKIHEKSEGSYSDQQLRKIHVKLKKWIILAGKKGHLKMKN